MACYERNVAVPDMLDRIHKEGDILIRCVMSAAATSRGEPLETTRRTKHAIKLVDGEERGHDIGQFHDVSSLEFRVLRVVVLVPWFAPK